MAPPASSHQPPNPQLAENVPQQQQLQKPKTKSFSQSAISSSPRALATPVRSLTISKPKTKKESEVSSTFKSTIILVAKYTFAAESSNELSVTKGDILKMLDQPRDGWILVKYIDKVHAPGLIPASYVDIAVNDQTNPITINWLHGNENPDIVKEHNYLNLQFNKTEAIFETINNKAYPVSASISNFLLYKDRYWYRLDVEFSDRSRGYLCRYYQNFYNLHISLLEFVSRANSQNAQSDDFKLPKLPEPLPTATDKSGERDSDSTTDSEKSFEQEVIQVNMLLQRCNDLNVYINKLILKKYFQTSKELIEWLELGYNELPGFILRPSDEDYESKLTNDEINTRILSESIDVLKDHEEKKSQLEQELQALKKAEIVDKIDDADLPARTKSKNIYNNYQQASHMMSMSQASRHDSVKLGRAMSKSNHHNESRVDGQKNSPRVSHKQANDSTHADTSSNSISTSFSPVEEDNHGGGSPDTSHGSVKLSRSGSSKPKSLAKEPETPSQPLFTGAPVSSPQNSKYMANESIVPPNLQSPQLQQNSPKIASPVMHSPNYQYNPRLGSLPKVKTQPQPQHQHQHQPVHPNHDKPYHLPQRVSSKMSPLGVNSHVFPISGYTTARQPASSADTSHFSNPSSFSHSSGSPSPTAANALSNDNHQFIRCKIVNSNDEILTVKLLKSQIKTIGDFKNLIKSKVFYNKLFIKLPNLNNFENIDVVKFNITEFLKFNDRVLLRIA
ncbi:hypothetical protein CANMA_002180 [Candida margitis]|uniref:uncharacterized protein n=1 Tax=Candida margitis TaxID=1775924 RepID=UPI002227CBBA|nr:uncharacterized protein CANMA_002180 [Candida margitis]KAI5968744.1 hypothetical protein CANMA_002180 [Candida margitis]